MKPLIFIPLIYFLTVLQTSFLVFFDFRGYVLNYVFIVVLLFNIFENPRKDRGLILAILAGFFLDIFSSGPFGVNFFGLWVLTLFILSALAKYFLKRHLSFIPGR